MNALDTLSWAETSKALTAFVYRRVKDRSVAEDIVHDVYLKIHARIGQLKDTEKLMGWIYRITRNTITDYFRSNSKRPIEEMHWDDEKHPLNDCVETCLREMLGELPEKYREALELTEIRNVSQTELAARLKISYSGAKSRVQRARHLLKEMMEARYNIKADPYGNIIVCENKVPCNCPVPFEEMKSRW
jgi:RNA polymerase sigma-70 factor (ECF subfamily)